MRLAQSHLGKLRKTDAAAYFALQEDLERIAVPLGSEFPRTLSPVDQGKFALGYYQQRAADRAARAEAIAAREAEEQDETESPEEES
jgi:CRISPR-associated protein Csd1